MIRKFSFFCVILASMLFLLKAFVEIYQLEMGCFIWPGCYGATDIAEAAPAFHKPYFREPFAGAERLLDVVSPSLIGSLIFSVCLILILTWRNKASRLMAFISLLMGSAVVLVSLPFDLNDQYVPTVLSLNHLLNFLMLGCIYQLYLIQAPNALMVNNSRLRLLARLGLFALIAEVFLGGWQTYNGAGLACLDLPTCNGRFLPDADFWGVFNFKEGGYPNASVRIALNWMHRFGAFVIFALLLQLAVLLFSTRLRWAGLWLGFLLVLQIAIGVAVVEFRLLAAAVIAHDAVAALLLFSLLHICFYLRPSALPRVVVKEVELEVQPEAPVVEIEPASFFIRLKDGLGKTRNNLTGFLGKLTAGKIDKDVLEEIEASLLTADVGVQATQEIIAEITRDLERHELNDTEALMKRLRDTLYNMISACSSPLVIPEETKPFVILVVGVNGAGKTTTIGKLAKHLQNQGRSVMLAAGDTFRAAAIEQLQTWGERNQIPVIAQQSGADSASVIFDAVAAAKSRGVDVLIADTAGRLQTKSNLMEELTKIKRIMQKHDINAPHEVLLVLDACTGQNALSQAKLFNEAVGLTGLALTKLDGTAKGGVIFALGKQFGIPIRYIGVGEGIEDLHEFDASEFINALFAEVA